MNVETKVSEILDFFVFKIFCNIFVFISKQLSIAMSFVIVSNISFQMQTFVFNFFLNFRAVLNVVSFSVCDSCYMFCT